MWGKVEDITFIPARCIAFVKYVHRCLAEIAKEALQSRSLDYDELILIRWANEDPHPKSDLMFSESWHK